MFSPEVPVYRLATRTYLNRSPGLTRQNEPRHVKIRSALFADAMMRRFGLVANAQSVRSVALVGACGEASSRNLQGHGGQWLMGQAVLP